MFERTVLSCYSWLCAATGKEVHEKCSGKHVLINVLFGRQNLWRGGKRKKYLFFLPKKYQSTFPLGRGKRNIFFTIFNILLLAFVPPTLHIRLSSITLYVCVCWKAGWDLGLRRECLDERLYKNCKSQSLKYLI